jgi:hypothetical protein
LLDRAVALPETNGVRTQTQGVRVGHYSTVKDLKGRFANEIRSADFVVVGSCIQDGIAVGEWVTRTAQGATAFLTVQEEYGSFDAYCWQFVDGRPRQNRWKTIRQIPATTRESDAFSRDLKRRGFSFVGSTVMYGHMQAVGMVNDHLLDCFRYRDVRRLGAGGERTRPGGGTEKHK